MSAAERASIEVAGLTKIYRSPGGGSFAAVNDLSFTAPPGRIFGLLGPNGAGKTTTLRMLSTLIPPSSGRAMVGGFSVTDEPAAVRGRIGFLTGSTGLYPRLTARETVRYFAGLYGLETDAAEARIDDLFDVGDQLIGKLLFNRIDQGDFVINDQISVVARPQRCGVAMKVLYVPVVDTNVVDAFCDFNGFHNSFPSIWF